MGELVAQGLLDLTGKQLAIVPEVAFKRVAVDHDPVLVAILRHAVAEVLAIGMDLGPQVRDHHGDVLQHLEGVLGHRMPKVERPTPHELVEPDQHGPEILL